MTELPARCQSCVPDIDCVFFLSDDDDSPYDYDTCCTCPPRARLIALDVMDAGDLLRHDRVNLNDRAAVKAALTPWDFTHRSIEDGRLDDFIDRAVECARASL